MFETENSGTSEIKMGCSLSQVKEPSRSIGEKSLLGFFFASLQMELNGFGGFRYRTQCRSYPFTYGGILNHSWEAGVMPLLATGSNATI